VRALLVVCHPDEESFTAACAAAAERGLRRAGHDVEVLDLYTMSFQPVMTAAAHAAYHDGGSAGDELVDRCADLVKTAEMLVFVYPTWWAGLPAMLKGWLERTMLPGVAFVFDDSGKVRPGMRHIRRVIGVSTYGSPRWFVRVVNDNGRRTITRALRLNTGWRTRVQWFGLYGIDRATDAARDAFLHRVEDGLARA
jgi:putative NADPH-quinone reductase